MMRMIVKSEEAVEAEAAVEEPVEPEEVPEVEPVMEPNAPETASSSRCRTISLPYDLPNEILKAIIT